MTLRQLRAVTFLLLGVGTLGGGVLGWHSLAHAILSIAPAPLPDEGRGRRQGLAQTNKVVVDEQTIRELIKQLGDDSYDKREAADKRLAAIGEPAVALLVKALRETTDPEVRQRAKELIRVIGGTLFREVRRFEGHTPGRLPWITRVAVTPDGRQLVSAGYDGLRCWDVASGKLVLVIEETKGAGCWALALTSDGQRVMAGGDDKVVRIFDLKTGKLTQQFVGHSGAVWGAVFLANGKQALTGGMDQSLRVWDVESGKQIRAFEGVQGDVRCLALSPDGKWAAAGHFAAKDGPGTVRLWDMQTGKEIRSFAGHTQEVSSVAFSPDGTKLLSSSFDRTVRLWDVETGKEIKRFAGNPHRVEFAAFTPDGKRVVSCGNEQNPTVRLWDVASGQQLFETEAVVGGFLGLAVLPDGQHCVTGCRDSTVRLWQWTR
jgi:WD40 repeat protein